jgi:hypothetical protein
VCLTYANNIIFKLVHWQSNTFTILRETQCNFCFLSIFFSPKGLICDSIFDDHRTVKGARIFWGKDWITSHPSSSPPLTIACLCVSLLSIICVLPHANCYNAQELPVQVRRPAAGRDVGLHSTPAQLAPVLRAGRQRAPPSGRGQGSWLENQLTAGISTIWRWEGTCGAWFGWGSRGFHMRMELGGCRGIARRTEDWGVGDPSQKCGSSQCEFHLVSRD